MYNKPANSGAPEFSLEKMIHAIGNKKAAMTALRMFFSMGEKEYLAPLKTGIDAQDKNAIFTASHKLYGLAARLQMTGIAKAAEHIVHASRHNKTIDFKKYYSEIITLFYELKRKYSSIL
jgi:HPt (histidine-containing phosphotransfer) domain-containing protein